MIGLPPGTKVFLACQPIDLRAGFDGLAAKVRQITKPIALTDLTTASLRTRSRRCSEGTATYPIIELEQFNCRFTSHDGDAASLKVYDA